MGRVQQKRRLAEQGETRKPAPKPKKLLHKDMLLFVIDRLRECINGQEWERAQDLAVWLWHYDNYPDKISTWLDPRAVTSTEFKAERIVDIYKYAAAWWYVKWGK